MKTDKLLQLIQQKNPKRSGGALPLPKAQSGLNFLQPNSSKLKEGYATPSKYPSTELATSIGGEGGEPAYLVPSFKYGHPLANPQDEFYNTGDYLGGPFKTWQEADKWDREIRHPYVERGQPIPSPLKWWGEGYKKGGSLPKAQPGKQVFVNPTNVRESTSVNIPKFNDKLVGSNDIQEDGFFTPDYGVALANKLLKDHNVKIDSTGNILKDIGLPSGAYYNPITRTIHYDSNANNSNTAKRKYVRNVIQEVPHAIQADRMGTIPFLVNIGIDALSEPSSKRYYKKGTLENEAHHVIVPQLEDKIIKQISIDTSFSNPFIKRQGGSLPRAQAGKTTSNLEDLVAQYQTIQEQVNKGNQSKNAYIEKMRKTADDIIERKFNVNTLYPDYARNGNNCIGTSCYLADQAGDKFYPEGSSFFIDNSLAQNYAKDNPNASRYLEQNEQYLEPGDIIQFKRGSNEKAGPYHAFTVYSIGEPNEDGDRVITVVGTHGSGSMVKEDAYILGKDNKIYSNYYGGKSGTPHATQLLKRREGSDDSYNQLVKQRDTLKQQILGIDPTYFTPKQDIRSGDYKQTAFVLNDQGQANEYGRYVQTEDLGVDRYGNKLVPGVKIQTINPGVVEQAYDARSYIDATNSGLTEMLAKYSDPQYKYDYMKKHNISNDEYDALVSNIVGIYGAETKYGTDYTAKDKLPEWTWATKLADKLGIINQEEKSIGPFQLTYNDLPEAYRKTIKGHDLYNPIIAADAAMEYLTAGLPLLRKRANTTAESATKDNPYSQNITKENYLEYVPYLYSLRGWLKGDESTMEKKGDILKGEAGYKKLVDQYRNNVVQTIPLSFSDPNSEIIVVPEKRQGGSLPKAQVGYDQLKNKYIDEAILGKPLQKGVIQIPNPKFNSSIDNLPNRKKQAVVDALGNPRYIYLDSRCEDGDCNSFHYFNTPKVTSRQEYQKSQSMPVHKNGGSLYKAQSGGDYEQAKAQYIAASNKGIMGENQMQQLVKQYPKLAFDESLAGVRSVGNAALYRANEEHNRIETNTLGQVLSTPESRQKAYRQEVVTRRPGVYNVEDYKMGIQEPGATNDIMDDPIAMAIFATATGGVGLTAEAAAARGLTDVAADFAGNLASEATFGGYDFANSGFKSVKNFVPSKKTIETIKQGIKDFRANPKLTIAKWKYPEGTLQGDYVRHFETSVLPQNVKDGTMPTYIGRSAQDIFNDNKAAATNLNNTLKRRITELESQEGFNRLVTQETEYLRSIGFNKSNLSGNLPKNMTDDDAILQQATQNAKEAVDRMKNVHNMNQGILDEVNTAMQSNANFTGKDLENILTKHGYPAYNALANSGGKIIPPFITIGYGYGNNISAMEHEIMHILQHNREMPIDQQLKFLETADNLTPDQQADYDYFMNGKITNTVPGKSTEPAPFLAEIRNLMKEHGFIQNTYDPITPQMMEEAYNFFKKNPQLSYFSHKDDGPLFRSDQRIFDFMKPSKTNFNILSSLMNKLPAVAGVGVVGAGVMGAGSEGENTEMQKQKRGGLVKAQAGLSVMNRDTPIDPYTGKPAVLLPEIEIVGNKNSTDYSLPNMWESSQRAKRSAEQKQREDKQQQGLWAQRDNTSQRYNFKEGSGIAPELTPLQIADEVTDMMQMGHFVPLPPAQWIGLAGDALGAGIDSYQAGQAKARGDYDDMATNLAFAITSGILSKKGYTRDMWNTTPGSFADRIAKLGSRDGNYRHLTLPPRLANEPLLIERVNKNRGLLLNQGLETAYDSQYGETVNNQSVENSYKNFFGTNKELMPDEEWAISQGYDLDAWRALPSASKTKLMMNPKDKSMDFSLRMKPVDKVLKTKKNALGFKKGGSTPKNSNPQQQYFQLLINQKNKK